jgi:hypothetical protein
VCGASRPCSNLEDGEVRILVCVEFQKLACVSTTSSRSQLKISFTFVSFEFMIFISLASR